MAPTTNMNLTLPVVSQTPGPEWASTINSDLSLIDAHDHTSAKGARIPSAALNINDNINFASYSPYQVGYIGFYSQSGTLASNRQLYVNGGDLYYNNGTSFPVQITIGPSVAGAAGTITGLPYGSASASYNAGTSTFAFASATNTPANMDVGPTILRKNTANSAGITIQPSGSIVSNWTLTLPAAPPVSQSLLTIASNGTVSNATPNSTLTVTSSQIKVATTGITSNELATDSVITSKILNGNVTTVKLGSVTVGTSSFVTTTATATTTPTAVSGLSATITVQANNRPIFVTLLGDYTSPARPYVSIPSASPYTFIRLDSSGLTYSVATIPVAEGVRNPANLFSGIVLPVSAVAGSVLTFQVFVFTQSGTAIITFNDVYLSAYQL